MARYRCTVQFWELVSVEIEAPHDAGYGELQELVEAYFDEHGYPELTPELSLKNMGVERVS